MSIKNDFKNSFLKSHRSLLQKEEFQQYCIYRKSFWSQAFYENSSYKNEMYCRHATAVYLKNRNCRPHHSWSGKKNFFFHPLDCWKTHFPKEGKYFTVNKFAPFGHPYLNRLSFTRITALKMLKNNSQKNQNSGTKNRKITCLVLVPTCPISQEHTTSKIYY